MKSNKLKELCHSARQPLLVTLLLLLLCGLIFPLLLTGISALVFPHQAFGNMVTADGEKVGSSLVGQDFTKPYFMKCRPSAYNYNTYTEDENGNKKYNDGSEYGGLGSGSENLAPSNPDLVKRTEEDIEKFLKENPNVKKEEIPPELLAASGSGLDPHISEDSAKIQIPRIAKESGISEERLLEIVKNNTKGKILGVFGEVTVNVLGVNLEIAKEMGLISEYEK